jgi:hypothetical protein
VSLSRWASSNKCLLISKWTNWEFARVVDKSVSHWNIVWIRHFVRNDALQTHRHLWSRCTPPQIGNLQTSAKLRERTTRWHVTFPMQPSLRFDVWWHEDALRHESSTGSHLLLCLLAIQRERSFPCFLRAYFARSNWPLVKTTGQILFQRPPKQLEFVKAWYVYLWGHSLWMSAHEICRSLWRVFFVQKQPCSRVRQAMKKFTKSIMSAKKLSVSRLLLSWFWICLTLCRDPSRVPAIVFL